MNKTAIAKAVSQLAEASTLVAAQASGEQERFDEMSEKAQESEKGQQATEMAEELQEIADAIDELITKLEGFGE